MTDKTSGLARTAERFTDWAERWIPDAFIFALLATALVVGASFVQLQHEQPALSAAREVILVWGNGFWELIPFTLQMALVIITGSVVATTVPVYRLIESLAALPKTPRSAVAWVALLAMGSSWFNWGFSLIFSAMLAKEVARKIPSVDYRAVCAASFLGLGSVWAQGLSGSAALQMTTVGALQPAIRSIVAGPAGEITGGLISLKHTIFLWQSLLCVFIGLFSKNCGRIRLNGVVGE